MRDFRKCTSEAGFTVSSSNGFPVVHKVQLRMSLENVVKDIPSISDTSWTYGDLMVSMNYGALFSSLTQWDMTPFDICPIFTVGS